MRTKRSEAGAQAAYDLKYWGYWIGKQYAADGYPTQTPGYANRALMALFSGHSGMNPRGIGFGINIKDIPEDAWEIDVKIRTLRRELRDVLIARYCLPVDYDTGRPYSVAFLANVLCLSERTYSRRLEQARDKFARLVLAERNGETGEMGLTRAVASA